MVLKTVKLTLAFDGTRYEGWQSQRKDRTVQEVFEKALEKIFSQKIHLAGSSRTDSGVHARGFVAHFKVKSKLTDAAIVRALNFYLPCDIVVLKAQTVPATFHARFKAKSKIYRYTLCLSKTRPVFEAPYVLHYPYPVNMAHLQKAARLLTGRQDFRAFMDADSEKEKTVRYLKKIRIHRQGELLHFDFEGDGFLRHMVRILMGTLLEVNRGKISLEAIPFILKSRDRKKAGPTAKAQGLHLLKVNY